MHRALCVIDMLNHQHRPNSRFHFNDNESTMEVIATSVIEPQQQVASPSQPRTDFRKVVAPPMHPLHTALCCLPMLTGPSDEVGPSP